MSMDFMSFLPELEEALTELVSAGVYLRAPSFLLSIVAYIFTAISLFSIAKRRGIHHAWMSWIPVGNIWVLGAISDHFRFVTKGQNKAKRKVLLALAIVNLILGFIVLLVCGVVIVRVASMLIDESNFVDYTELGIQLVITLCLATPMLIVAAVSGVIQYIAMFDIFASADPKNRWLYMILSLMSPYALPLILFFNRKRDEGMPPRIPETNPQPAYQQPVYQQPTRPGFEPIYDQPTQPVYTQPAQPVYTQPVVEQTVESVPEMPAQPPVAEENI